MSLAGLLFSPGCGAHFAPLMGPDKVVAPAKSIPNPLFVPVANSELVWNQLVDELDDYFRIEREQRMQDANGVQTEGRIDTLPTPGATLLEPWRRDSTPGFERMQSTLQSMRRRATARVIPRQGGYLVEVQVIKELEDVSQPERSNVGGPSFRYDQTIVRDDGKTPHGALTLGWIVVGRDASLEQQILAELQARLGAPVARK